MDEAYPYLMLFTGDPLPDVSRRSLAVEPMTCPPNAFRSGEALIASSRASRSARRWGISPGQGAQRMNSGRPHRVVIVGAGFGGLFAAKFLRRAPVEVLLLDRTNHHLFQPLLYQVATGILSAGEVAPRDARHPAPSQERDR